MLKEERIREISKSINEISEDVIDYMQIYQCTSMIFDAVFGSDKIFEGGDSHISVNIQKIISEFGMEIFPHNQGYQHYSEEPNFIGGTVTLNYRKRRKIVFINEAINEDYRRLALAIHLYYYLKYYEDDKVINISTPLMPCKYDAMDEVIAKIFARMILLPPSVIANEFYAEYKGEYNNFCGCENKWYEYLSSVAKVSKEEAAIGWQEARIVLKLLDK